MKLKKGLVVLYIVFISMMTLFVVNLNYDRFARNNSINVGNVTIVEEYLDEEEITYLIDNNIDYNLFSKFVKDDGFILMNYQYYNLIDKYYPDYTIEKIVDYGNAIVDREFRLKRLGDILSDYTPAQMLNLADYKTSISATQPNVDAQYYPSDNTAYVNSTNYILDYKPKDMVAIDAKYLTNPTSKVYIDKNAYDKFEQLCSDLTLISNSTCGNLKIDTAYISYKEFDNTPKSLKPFVNQNSNELQLGKSIVFSNEDKLMNNSSYLWLLDNAHIYGFIQRYPDDKINVTKVSDNLNIFRFVGVEDATKLYNNNWVLEDIK